MAIGSSRRPAAPTSAASAAATRTRPRRSPPCSRWPTAWAAHAPGEVASRWPSEAFAEADRPASAARRRELAEHRTAANRAIYKLAREDADARGMGTTLTAAMVAGREVSIGHVGDSRTYRFRDGELERSPATTRSWRSSSAGQDHRPRRPRTIRSARSSRARSGPSPSVEVDTYTLPGRDGDIFLICSDGLTGMVSDEELGAILVRPPRSTRRPRRWSRREPERRAGQHHRRAVPARRRRRAATADDSGTMTPAPTRRHDRRDDERGRRGPPPSRHRDSATARTSRAPWPSAPRRRHPSHRARARPRSAPADSRAPPRRARARPAGSPRLDLVGARCSWRAVVGLYAPQPAGLLRRHRTTAGSSPCTEGSPTSCRSASTSTSRSTRAACRPAPSRPRAAQRVLDHQWRSRDDAVDLVRQLERGQLDGR